ncbi:Inosine-5'-monophosphate dehydrogenase [Candidatus Norongarragalina meridionalis]|nr:Inosine-5'-monophosphate dehydrogenase [Candidatus Norongarragalina meridionalis]
METGVKAGDCMRRSLVTISEDASMYEAARVMTEAKVGGLLVTDSKKKIYAIMTDDDIVRKAVATKKMDLKVKDIASKPLVGVSASADINEAAKLMGQKNIKRLAVFDAGKIVGIMSERDIVRISPSLYDLIAEKEHLKQ